jgi:RNA polymerase sigma-70 factor (ECF subfamily)
MLQTQKSAQKSDAIGVLYDRYGRLVHSVILHIVHNPSAAEDLVQETFLRIWSRIRLFDSERGDLKCWILTIGRHCAFDYLRSAEGRNDRSSCNGIFEHLAGGLTGELAVAPESLPFFLSEAPLGKAMARLSANQRRALELAYFEGMSQTEIAQAVHQPLGTVKTWVRTALQLLRGELCPTSTVLVPLTEPLTGRRNLAPLNTAAVRPSTHLRQSWPEP